MAKNKHEEEEEKEKEGAFRISAQNASMEEEGKEEAMN